MKLKIENNKKLTWTRASDEKNWLFSF